MENNQDNSQVSASSTESCSSDLTDVDEVSNRIPLQKENPAPAAVFLKRNRQQLSTEDETLEGFEIFNGLELKMGASTSKMLYVYDTEDFLLRKDGKAKIAREGDGDENGFQATSEKEIKAATSEKEIKAATSEKEIQEASEKEIKATSEKEIQAATSEKEIQATFEKEFQATSEQEIKTTSEKEIFPGNQSGRTKSL